ncbi:MAG: phosphotransferase [Chloroflexota bacterium]|nr:phosphotransferase [Chloroflexota bacterium]
MTVDGDNALAALVSRALGEQVQGARSEIVTRDDAREIERVHFSQGGRQRSLLLKRLRPDAAMEVQLLPFLTRKSPFVPLVFARGIPRPRPEARHWLLVEDLSGAPTACDFDPREIVRAKIAIERAVERDGPALGALGVPRRSPAALVELAADGIADGELLAEARKAARWLATWPESLTHGDLVCGNVVRTERGTVIHEWGSAFTGCALLDVVRLAADFASRGEARLGVGLPRLYAEERGTPLSTAALRAAELVDKVMRRSVTAPRPDAGSG